VWTQPRQKGELRAFGGTQIPDGRGDAVDLRIRGAGVGCPPLEEVLLWDWFWGVGGGPGTELLKQKKTKGGKGKKGQEWTGPCYSRKKKQKNPRGRPRKRCSAQPCKRGPTTRSKQTPGIEKMSKENSTNRNQSGKVQGKRPTKTINEDKKKELGTNGTRK